MMQEKKRRIKELQAEVQVKDALIDQQMAQIKELKKKRGVSSPLGTEEFTAPPRSLITVMLAKVANCTNLAWYKCSLTPLVSTVNSL